MFATRLQHKYDAEPDKMPCTFDFFVCSTTAEAAARRTPAAGIRMETILCSVAPPAASASTTEDSLTAASATYLRFVRTLACYSLRVYDTVGSS